MILDYYFAREDKDGIDCWFEYSYEPEDADFMESVQDYVYDRPTLAKEYKTDTYEGCVQLYNDDDKCAEYVLDALEDAAKAAFYDDEDYDEIMAADSIHEG